MDATIIPFPETLCEMGCECERCQLEFPEDFTRCDQCGAKHLTDNMQACWTMSEGGEIDHYLCDDCERRSRSF